MVLRMFATVLFTQLLVTLVFMMARTAWPAMTMLATKWAASSVGCKIVESWPTSKASVLLWDPFRFHFPINVFIPISNMEKRDTGNRNCQNFDLRRHMKLEPKEIFNDFAISRDRLMKSIQTCFILKVCARK